MKAHLCMVLIIGSTYACSGHVLAQNAKPSSQAPTSTPAASPVRAPIGMAEMLPDKSIDLYLKTSPGQLQINSGSVGSMQMTIKPGDSDYQKWIRQVGGLKVGERKPIPPLGDDFSQPAAQPSKPSAVKPTKHKSAKSTKTN